MDVLQINLLGSFKMSRNDTLLTTITGGKIFFLLAFLLLNRFPQSRKYISFLFWLDSSEKQALTNLRKLLLQLRQALPDADRCLMSDTLSIGWYHSFPCDFDVVQFEKYGLCTSLEEL